MQFWYTITSDIHIRTHFNSAIVFNKGNIGMHAHIKIVICDYFIYVYYAFKHVLYCFCREHFCSPF